MLDSMRVLLWAKFICVLSLFTYKILVKLEIQKDILNKFDILALKNFDTKTVLKGPYVCKFYICYSEHTQTHIHTYIYIHSIYIHTYIYT